MTTNKTLTGPGWHKAAALDAGARVLLTTGDLRDVQFAAVNAGASAPPDTLTGHRVTADGARDGHGETASFGRAVDLYVRAPGVQAGANPAPFVVLTILD